MTNKVNFGDELVSPEEKTRRVGAVFSSVARRYDVMNDLMSGGMHRLWKDRFVRRVKPRAGETILDMAGGTGDIAFRMAAARRAGHRRRHQPRHARGRQGAGRDSAASTAWSGQVENAETLSFADASFDAYTIAFGIRNVTDIPAALARGAPRAEARRALLLPRILDQRLAGLRRALRRLFAQRRSRASARRSPTTRTAIAIWSKSIRRFPDMPERSSAMIAEAGFVRAKAEPMLGGLVAIHSGLEDLTTSVTHLWRLLKWGRTLARHGALRGHRARSATPRRRCAGCARIARFGARMPPTPDYAAAFQAIGPAAIKLGQALVDPPRPGRRARRRTICSQLQDDLPPAPFAAIKPTIERALRRAARELFAEIDPVPVGAASIAQVHRAVTTEGRDVAVKVLRPGIEEEFASAIETYEWAAAQVERSAARPRGCARAWSSPHFRQWTARELDLQREAASASELRENMVAEPGYLRPRDRLAPHRAAGC